MLNNMGGIFKSFYGNIKICDGIFGEYTDAKRIVCLGSKTGFVKEFETGKWAPYTNAIIGVKYLRGGRVIEHLRVEEFHLGVTQFNEKRIPGRVMVRFRKGYREVLHGIAIRENVQLFGIRGTVKTKYSCGRFIWQQFRYSNRRMAYFIKATDHQATVKYPNGKIAGFVDCGKGSFSTRAGKKASWGHNETATCINGEVYFPFENGFKMNGETDAFDFSKNGNCKIQFWDRDGKTKFKGEYRDRQRVGEWVVNGTRIYIINGVEVEKKLWDTPPAKMSITKVLKLKNAQLRMALMSRIGYERLARELKHKVIHEDKKRQNKLIQLPIKVSVGAGNGSEPSYMRILIVTCTSTRQKYYLTVPDYIAPHGKRIYLNTCEAARQWTFHVDDPRKNIKFQLET